MYLFGDFAKLIIILLVIAIIFLVYRWLQNRTREEPDDSESRE